MKKLFRNIWTWVKSLFSSKKEIVSEEPEVSELTEEQKFLADRFSKDNFDSLKENGFFEDDPNRERTKMEEDLSESARKLNEYKDSQKTKVPDEFVSIALNEAAKDRTTMIRKKMELDEAEANKYKPKKTKTKPLPNFLNDDGTPVIDVEKLRTDEPLSKERYDKLGETLSTAKKIINKENNETE